MFVSRGRMRCKQASKLPDHIPNIVLYKAAILLESI